MRTGAGFLLLALVATGCSDPAEPPQRYAALGDSFTAGAGLTEEMTGTGICQQSRLSYPHLVAAELDLELADASCAGAATENGANPQPRTGEGEWPPQLAQVTRTTDIVTVGLGYNDFIIFGSAFTGCAQVAAEDPTGTPCQDRQQPEASRQVDQIGLRLERLLAAVHDRAPEARVLLVGYPQLVPASGSCAELPLATGDYAYVRQLFIDLDDAMRAAADAADATYVDVMGPSQGHDVCSGADAWTTGATPSTVQRASFHPLPIGQEQVAQLVLAALR